MKKADHRLNSVIGAFAGTFIGHGIYVIWTFKASPELYAMQSAPWYTSIFAYGVFTIAVLAVCFLLKGMLSYFVKKTAGKPAE